jgi:hypothetical protein
MKNNNTYLIAFIIAISVLTLWINAINLAHHFSFQGKKVQVLELVANGETGETPKTETSPKRGDGRREA